MNELKKAKEMNSQTEERLSYLILVLPALLIYLFVMAFPTVFSVILSLTNYNGGKVFGNPKMTFAGLKAYGTIFQDPYFFMALKNNGLVVLISVFGQIPLGFILA
jgi:raffinose/stachyose/melibiose transport system permease protein